MIENGNDSYLFDLDGMVSESSFVSNNRSNDVVIIIIRNQFGHSHLKEATPLYLVNLDHDAS